MKNRKRKNERIVFTKEMKRSHTILIPEMLPIHFEFIQQALEDEGYQIEMLHNRGSQLIHTGLRYIHNDICYPALLVLGQFIDALQSGKYDLEKTALLFVQTGGGCRASNYIHLYRKGLTNAGFGNVPVIGISLNGFEKNPGFGLTIDIIRKCGCGLIYGDLLMLLSNQVRPYEVNKGEADTLVQVWIKKIRNMMHDGKGLTLAWLRKLNREIVSDFDHIPCEEREKTKVGIVGEIYMKYAPLGNNDLVRNLESNDCECMVPGIMAYALYCVNMIIERIRIYGGNKLVAAIAGILLWHMGRMEKTIIDAVAGTKFTAPSTFSHIHELTNGVIGYDVTMGEGWMLPGEILDLAELGYPNIVCTQPFGCMPNHIVGRGIMSKVRERNPRVNAVAVDYDPGAPSVNQENRIKLMLATARS